MKKLNNYLRGIDKRGSLTTDQYKKIQVIGSSP